jgi:UDP-3-O-[3-hydroxymyristoyl] glucosamine N-acyltransferase
MGFISGYSYRNSPGVAEEFMLAAQTIQKDHAAVFTWLSGDLERVAKECHVPPAAGPDSLVFVGDEAQLDCARQRKPAIVIVQAKLVTQAAALDSTSCCFSVRNISTGMSLILKYFDRKRARFEQWGARHPTALVHADARIGQGVCLGPYCVIGAGANIGDGCLIGSHTVIDSDVTLGAACIVHPHVFIGAGCEVGERCEIHPHTSIGGDGFGYALDQDGKPRKISHLGVVQIGDDVEIGSNCAIDRATLTATYIRSGAKLDNLCHIAHNCDLGENGFYTAGFMMGGSTKIGRQFSTGGNSVVTSHITITDNVSLSGRSSVTKDVTEPGHYAGYPLQPLKEAMKTAVSIGQLNKIRKNLQRVLKHLKLDDEAADPPVL